MPLNCWVYVRESVRGSYQRSIVDNRGLSGIQRRRHSSRLLYQREWQRKRGLGVFAQSRDLHCYFENDWVSWEIFDWELGCKIETTRAEGFLNGLWAYNTMRSSKYPRGRGRRWRVNRLGPLTSCAIGRLIKAAYEFGLWLLQYYLYKWSGNNVRVNGSNFPFLKKVKNT